MVGLPQGLWRPVEDLLCYMLMVWRLRWQWSLRAILRRRGLKRRIVFHEALGISSSTSMYILCCRQCPDDLIGWNPLFPTSCHTKTVIATPPRG